MNVINTNRREKPGKKTLIKNPNNQPNKSYIFAP